ncbi:MAG: protein kinase [Actinomycetota bacterium]|nr:protein kinase [Actinomycetota bacterium]
MTTDGTHLASALPGYVLLERIGAGALTTVYRAHVAGHPEQVVAIKRLRMINDPDAIARARREAEALAKLRHPAIARILDVIPDGEGVAIVLPYLEGGSLADRLAMPDPLHPASVAFIGATMAEALGVAHAHGIVHRDVKPANILFNASDEPVLSDFGAARIEGEQRLTAHGHNIGTAEYLDPAVAAGREPDARSDIYALGVVSYEALTGTPPYAGSTPLATLRAADRGLHVPLAEAAPDAPPRLVATIERAMSRDPAERFASAYDLAASFRAARREIPAHAPNGDRASADASPPAASSTPSSPPSGDVGVGERSGGTQLFGPRPTPPQPESVPERRSHRLALLAAVVLLMTAGLAAAIWLGLWDRPQAREASSVPASGPPVTMPVPADEPAAIPIPNTRGRDFDRIVREMLAFQDWLKSHPRPELLSTIYDPSCPCYPQAVNELATLRDQGLRFERQGVAVEKVEVVQATDNRASVKVSLRHLDQDLVAVDRGVVRRVEGGGLRLYEFTLGLAGDQWRITAATRTG